MVVVSSTSSSLAEGLAEEAPQSCTVTVEMIETVVVTGAAAELAARVSVAFTLFQYLLEVSVTTTVYPPG